MQYYYEFDEHEYYALVAVNVDDNDLKTLPHKKAAEIYVETVGGNSLESVLNEAQPNLRTKEYAFMRFFNASDVQDVLVKEALKDFNETTDGLLLVDGSLV